MTRLDKVKAFIAYEITWAIDLEAKDEIKNVTEYIVALFDSYSDKAIDDMYDRKFNN